MGTLPQIGTLWIGGALRWIERLCLHSFCHHGHEVTVFAYGDVQGLPEGVILRDAREIWDCPDDILSQCPAAYVADVFRLFLVQQTDMIWVDTDALCLAPFERDEKGYLLGYVPEVPMVNNGVMGLPRGSGAVQGMLDVFADDAFIPGWLPKRMQRRLGRLSPDERRLQRPHVFRTFLGPPALTALAKETGEIAQAQRPQVLFPVPWHSVDLLFNPHGGVQGWMDEGTISMHIYTSAVRDWHLNRKPSPGSFLKGAMAQMAFSWGG